MTVEFDMSEVADLAGDLAKAGAKADRHAAKQLKAATSRLRDDIERDAPVLTGDTKSSVSMKMSRGVGTVTAGSAAFYLEFGTSDTRPQPFVWRNIPPAVKQLTEALAEITPFDP